MTTGFKNSAGTDTDDLYYTGNSGLTTGFKRSDGTDLGSIYLAYATGTKRGASGLKNSAGTDLSDLFQASNVPPFVVALDSGTVSHTVADPSDASASIQLNTDGTISVGTGNSNGADTAWGSPTTVGIGSSYWVRATVTSGSLTNGTTGAWLQLSSARAWEKVRTTVGTASCTITLEIATDSGGSNIVDSASITLTATVE